MMSQVCLLLEVLLEVADVLADQAHLANLGKEGPERAEDFKLLTVQHLVVLLTEQLKVLLQVLRVELLVVKAVEPDHEALMLLNVELD
jgi:hypothetical protein